MSTSRIAVVVRADLDVTHLHAQQANRNGTAPEELMDGIQDAVRAVRKALKKVEATVPNARDWQTVEHPGTEYTQARVEHCERVRKLCQVEQELMLLWQDIDAQVG